jgi:hypothetical protein
MLSFKRRMQVMASLPEWADLIFNHRYATPIDNDSNLELTDKWLSPEELTQRITRTTC